MKENPYRKSVTRPKLKYTVHLDGEVYHTSAHNEEAALSNAAFRYADDHDEAVRLVRWKIKEGKIDVDMEEE